MTSDQIVDLIRAGFTWMEKSPTLSTLSFNYGHSHGQISLAVAGLMVDSKITTQLYEEAKEIQEKTFDRLSKQV